MTPEEAHDARRLKRLEMLQAIITRLAQNSFTIKAWATTFCSAILALGAKDGNVPFALLATAPAFIFWVLDAYYLWLERRYRALYELGAAALDPAMTLSLGDPPRAPQHQTFLRAMGATAVYPLYVLLLALSIAIAKYAHAHAH